MTGISYIPWAGQRGVFVYVYTFLLLTIWCVACLKSIAFAALGSSLAATLWHCAHGMSGRSRNGRRILDWCM